LPGVKVPKKIVQKRGRNASGPVAGRNAPDALALPVASCAELLAIRASRSGKAFDRIRRSAASHGLTLGCVRSGSGKVSSSPGRAPIDVLRGWAIPRRFDLEHVAGGRVVGPAEQREEAVFHPLNGDGPPIWVAPLPIEIDVLASVAPPRGRLRGRLIFESRRPPRRQQGRGAAGNVERHGAAPVRVALAVFAESEALGARDAHRGRFEARA